MQAHLTYIKGIYTDTDVRPGADVQLLIKKCAAQDPGAQKALYTRYNKLIRAVVERYIGDAALAEETFNDVFCRIFLKIHLYKPIGSFEGWMKKVAVNTILNQIKKNIHRPCVFIDDVDQKISISPEILGKFTFNELVGMIQSLPDIQKVVFNLFVFEGYSHKEIAKLVGIKEGNSKWHLNSARQKLQQKLNSSNYE